MAFTIINGPTVPMVTRGKPVQLGSIAALNQAVAFTIPNVNASPNGNDYLVISMGGTAIVGLVAALEASIDAGASWFVVTAVASSLSVSSVPDTAAQFVGAFLTYGLSGPALFRFGVTTFTSGGPGTVWAALS